MIKKNTISVSDGIIRNLKIEAKKKEDIRRKLAVTVERLVVTAAKLATTSEKKESLRRKKLALTAAKLAITAETLAATAREKEIVRRKLAVTAETLAVTAETLAVTAEKLALTAREKEIVRRKLAITAREKESARRKLLVTAEKLKKSYETLEQKVFERTESLEMARAKEEAVLLSIGDGLLATDEKGSVIFINKTAEKLLGKKNKEVVGKIFSDVIPLEDEKRGVIPPERHPVNLVLSGASTAVLPAVYYKRQDKKMLPLAVTATPVVLNGKVIGTIKVFRDITFDREIDRAKTEFVSLASHQLRTPLSTVNWYAEMLLAGDVGELNDKQKKYLDEVYRSNQRMVELVNALLNVASLELGTFVIEPESVDICKLAESAINEEKPQILARKIRFSFSYGKNISHMQADPKLLRMIVQNILSNAVKYTPEGGKINLSITLKDKNNILLKVSDTGYGIPKNQQNKIFTKLFRADNVRDKDTDGTGLGLYIVKSIVENSGGKIWFVSSNEGKNKGSTFFVVLPLMERRKVKLIGNTK